MRKQLLFIAGIILISFSINAQFNSGSLFVSGKTALSLDYSGEKIESIESSPDGHKLTNLTFNTSAGYFIKNRMAVGGFIDYTFDKTKSENNSNRECSSLIGPLFRYYINYSVSGIMPFAEADAGIGMSRSKYEYTNGSSEYKYSIFRVSGGAGINYFLNDNIAFETQLKYYYMTEKEKDGSSDEKYLYNGILFRLGITLFFSSI